MPSYSFLQSATIATDLSTYTFASQNLGAAADDRQMIVAVTSRTGSTGAPKINTITVGGIPATIVRQNAVDTGSATANFAAIAIANIPTGATGDVVVNFSATMVRCCIGLYRVTGGASVHWAVASSANDPTGTIDVPANGFVIGAAMIQSTGATVTWSGLTEDYEESVENATLSGASATFASGATGQSILANFSSGTSGAGLFTSWGETIGKHEIRYISGAAAATSTVTMPNHLPGDFIKVFVFRDGSTTSPTIPTTWLSTQTGVGTTLSIVTAYRIASTDTEVTGTFTNATGIVVAVYRKHENAEWALSNDAAFGAFDVSNTLSYSGDNLPSSIAPLPGWWYIRAAGHRTATDLLTDTPSGWTSRVGVATECRIIDTGGAVTSDSLSVGSNTQTVNASSGWATTTRLLAARAFEANAVRLISCAAINATTITIPQHQAGDLLVMMAYRNASTTVPTLPAGWTSIDGSGADTNSARLAYKIATSSIETSGTWTNATGLIVHVYRNAVIGNTAVNGGVGTDIIYPALTLQKTDHTSRVLRLCGHRTATGLHQPVNASLPGYQLTCAQYDEVRGVHTEVPVDSNLGTGTETVSVSSGWRAYSVEIMSNGSALPPNGFFQMF